MANREGVRTEDMPFFTFYDQSSRWAMKSLRKTQENNKKRGNKKGFLQVYPLLVHYVCIVSVMLVLTGYVY